MRSPLHAHTPSVVMPAGGRSPLVRPEERLPLIFLGTAMAAICLLLALAAAGSYEPSPAALGEMALLAASLASAAALWSLTTSPSAWSGTRWAARAATAAVAFQSVAWVNRSWNGRPADGGIAVGTMLFLLAIFVGALVIDFLQHVTVRRSEFLSDAAVVAVLAWGGVFLLQHGQDVSAPAAALSAIVALEAVVVFAGWSILALWCPSAVHFALFICATLAGAAAVLVDHGWHNHALAQTPLGPEVGASLAILALTGILVIEPRRFSGQPGHPRAAWWARPMLLALSLLGAFVLVVVALFAKHSGLSLSQSMAMATAAFAAIGIRSLVSHVGLGRATARLRIALHDREAAITSLRNTADTVAASEARHRLILDAAVDGVVELDTAGTITPGQRSVLRHGPPDPPGGRRQQVGRDGGAGRRPGRDAGRAARDRGGQPGHGERHRVPAGPLLDHPNRPPGHASADPRRHPVEGGRADDPNAVPVPPGSRRGPAPAS